MTYDRRKIPTNIITSEPAIEPVSVKQVKDSAFIVDDDSFNERIRDWYIPTARKMVEKIANRSLITQTRKQIYDFMPCAPIVLRFSPVQSLSSFTYLDGNLSTQTVASTLYRLDANSIPARLEIAYGQTWPTNVDVSQSVNLTYVAGYGLTAASVPIIYREAIIWLAGHWCQNPDMFLCEGADVQQKLEDILAIEGVTREYV